MITKFRLLFKVEGDVLGHNNLRKLLKTQFQWILLIKDDTQ